MAAVALWLQHLGRFHPSAVSFVGCTRWSFLPALVNTHWTSAYGSVSDSAMLGTTAACRWGPARRADARGEVAEC